MAIIKRIGGRIGAEILGIDLSEPIDDSLAKEINSALVEHKVIIFRGQDLDDEAHVRFASVFGPLTTAQPTVPSVAGQQNVLEIAAGEGARANSWHTDVTFLLTPPKATTLRSLVIPPYDGDTSSPTRPRHTGTCPSTCGFGRTQNAEVRADNVSVDDAGRASFCSPPTPRGTPPAATPPWPRRGTKICMPANSKPPSCSPPIRTLSTPAAPHMIMLSTTGGCS